MKCHYCKMSIPFPGGVRPYTGMMNYYKNHLIWGDCCPKGTLLSEIKDVLEKAEKKDLYE